MKTDSVIISSYIFVWRGEVINYLSYFDLYLEPKYRKMIMTIRAPFFY